MGWLKDILEENRCVVESWPEWKREVGMRSEAEIYSTVLEKAYKLESENAQLKAELAQATQQVKRGQP